MALSDAQQELLHAFVDGETSPAETVTARELTARDPEAAAYCQELRRLRHLLATHGCVTAPNDLHRRVCHALQCEFDRPTVLPLSRMLWRAGLYAAAAAVVLGVGMTFGPQWQSTGKSSDVARQSRAPTHEVHSEVAPGAWSPSGPEVADKAFSGPPASVLRLNRGVDQTFELSLELDRNHDAVTFQVYNDILVVCSHYGAARLLDHAVRGADSFAEFAGRDFSDFHGVEIELNEARVPELLAALQRMSLDQSYGRVVVPSDLRRPVGESAEVVAQIQARGRETESHDKSAQPDDRLGAGAYLPLELQHALLKRKLEAQPDQPQASVKAPQARAGDAAIAASASEPAKSRKVKLLIRLR